jgi:DNA-binding IclR family transcriptional regulator
VTDRQIAVRDAVAAGISTVPEIATHTGIDKIAVRYALGALHTKGYVARKPTPHTFKYFLTAKAGS